MGDHIQLSSHGYPNYYPANAYVLWTFQYASDMDSTDVVYVITFVDVSLGSYDYLTIGSNSSLIVSYGNDYSGRPDDLLLEAGDIFVEFYANSDSQDTGFQFEIKVEYMPGKND